jgi:hypothetical protein
MARPPSSGLFVCGDERLVGVTGMHCARALATRGARPALACRPLRSRLDRSDYRTFYCPYLRRLEEGLRFDSRDHPPCHCIDPSTGRCIGHYTALSENRPAGARTPVRTAVRSRELALRTRPAGLRPRRFALFSSPEPSKESPSTASRLCKCLVKRVVASHVSEAVPELTRSVGIKLYERVSLRRCVTRLGCVTGQFPQTSGHRGKAARRSYSAPLGGFVFCVECRNGASR